MRDKYFVAEHYSRANASDKHKLIYGNLIIMVRLKPNAPFSHTLEDTIGRLSSDRPRYNLRPFILLQRLTFPEDLFVYRYIIRQ